MTTDISNVTGRIINNFEDPACNEVVWTYLLGQGETDTINLTWQWQRSWWKSFGRGQLMLVLAERDGKPVALAPFFSEEGMIYNICPEDSLDFIGNVTNPKVMDALLSLAMDRVADFLGFRLYFISETSRTGAYLQDAAKRLNLVCHDEESLPSPYLDLAGEPQKAAAAPRKKSLRRHENYFLREGTLRVVHAQTAMEIKPHLEDFFCQHIRRRSATTDPSLFCDATQRDYYRRLTEDIGPTGWLRFSRLDWNDRPIAFHYGSYYHGRYLFGIPSFDIALADHSPGEVLIRQLLLAAMEEGAQIFDFGIGDEPYKYRFATHAPRLHTWGLYPIGR